MRRQAGAPKGGYVHWLCMSLNPEFKKAYLFEHTVEKTDNKYNKHHYTYYRLQGRKIYDCFIIIQSSQHYWQVTYFNARTKTYDSFGDCKTTRLAKRMWFLYEIDKRNRVDNNNIS